MVEVGVYNQLVYLSILLTVLSRVSQALNRHKLINQCALLHKATLVSWGSLIRTIARRYGGLICSLIREADLVFAQRGRTWVVGLSAVHLYMSSIKKNFIIDMVYFCLFSNSFENKINDWNRESVAIGKQGCFAIVTHARNLYWLSLRPRSPSPSTQPT